MGIDKGCADSINALARSLCQRQLTFESFRTLQDTIARLSAIDGIGENTAHYIAMRAFGESDAFPSDDRALKYGLGISEATAPSKKILSLAEAWRPWRAYAVMHLWAANAAL